MQHLPQDYDPRTFHPTMAVGGSIVADDPLQMGDDDDDDDKPDKRSGRRKIKIEYIEDKSRRHITFSKRKAGIMKKAYELSTLTGTQVLLLVVSETGLVYTFTTPKLQPLVTKPEGKNLIQACLNAPDGASPDDTPQHGGASSSPLMANSTTPNAPTRDTVAVKPEMYNSSTLPPQHTMHHAPPPSHHHPHPASQPMPGTAVQASAAIQQQQQQQQQPGAYPHDRKIPMSQQQAFHQPPAYAQQNFQDHHHYAPPPSPYPTSYNHQHQQTHQHPSYMNDNQPNYG